MSSIDATFSKEPRVQTRPQKPDQARDCRGAQSRPIFLQGQTQTKKPEPPELVGQAERRAPPPRILLQQVHRRDEEEEHRAGSQSLSGNGGKTAGSLREDR